MQSLEVHLGRSSARSPEQRPVFAVVKVRLAVRMIRNNAVRGDPLMARAWAPRSIVVLVAIAVVNWRVM